MMGISEWSFVILQAFVIAAVILITFPLADRLSDAWYNLKQKRQKKKMLNKFKQDVFNYIEASEGQSIKDI